MSRRPFLEELLGGDVWRAVRQSFALAGKRTSQAVDFETVGEDVVVFFKDGSKHVARKIFKKR